MSNKSPEFLVRKTPCNNCLLSQNRIVSPARANEVISECLENNTHFVCHLHESTCCNSFYFAYMHLILKLKIFTVLGWIKFTNDGEKNIYHESV